VPSGHDNAVKWRGLSLQIPPSPLRAHFVSATVRVHETPTVAWRSFTGRIGWPITTARTIRAKTPSWLREPFRQPACGFVDNAPRSPQPPRLNHLMFVHSHVRCCKMQACELVAEREAFPSGSAVQGREARRQDDG